MSLNIAPIAVEALRRLRNLERYNFRNITQSIQLFIYVEFTLWLASLLQSGERVSLKMGMKMDLGQTSCSLCWGPSAPP